MSETKEILKLSSAEISIFQQLDAQVKQLQQQQLEIIKSIFDSRDIDISKVEGDVSLLPDFSGIAYLPLE